MSTQSEAVLENKLMKQLVDIGYENIKIDNEDQLKENLKFKIEKFNKIKLTNSEFDKILTHLESGTIFNKAEKLRDKYELIRDDGTVYIEFFNKKDWCKNIFQVANQISFEDKYKTRYDVTILINGLPLIQIELKRRGGSLKKAFNQISRYQRHSYRGLFNYVQIFVISNGVNTKYFANNKDQNYKFTFSWKDKNNRNINQLEEFAENFLEPYNLSKMISKYMVLNQTNKNLMVLRAYQYYAVEAIVDRAINTNLNGYVWHTTGSGKTLTSFKVSQILSEEADIDKVVFVVDRKDLDYQTTKEFNSFALNSVDGTENTKSLVKQLKSKDKMIITTIQKLNRAVERYQSIESVKDKKIILIFDECHRSQFGEMHKRITGFFNNLQYFGFTGTPIFAENSKDGKTTKDLFDKKLHTYVIKDAIADDNVLGFSVEYWGKHINKLDYDKDVEAIDIKGHFESDLPGDRLDTITDFIIEKHDKITYNKEFNGLFAVNSIDVLKKYYKLFKEKIESKNLDLKIATIFSYDANEDLDDTDIGSAVHSRDFLEDCIEDYNKMFGSDYTTGDFGAYYVDLAKRFKNKQIDILIVVNMFLTGFDSKLLNTLYVDKNLEYHSLLQAYSRTNRIYNDKKSHGKIICFRNLKKATDDSIKLYSNEDAIETVLMKPYINYVNDFNEYLREFRNITLTVDDVDNLNTDMKKRNFIAAYNNLLRILNKLKSFTEFTFNDINIDEQTMEDYKSKYLDIRDTITHGEIDKESILNDVDFEMDLIRQDDINVSYILNLMRELDIDSPSFKKDKKNIIDVINRTEELRSKQDLIEEFINKDLPIIKKDEIDEKFEDYVDRKRNEEFNNIIKEENIDEESTKEFLSEYEYSGKIKKDIIKKSIKEEGLGFRQRRNKIKILVDKITDFVDKFTF